ncbi:MAG: hypothetical protein HOC79_01815 [Euryarchaeota archaeon]|nr:hypothetical protein [Euryarchaeota archaeon]
MRAGSVKHAQYDLTWVMLYGESPEGREIDDTLYSLTVGYTDKVAIKRTRTAMVKIQKALTTMMMKRANKLPDGHYCEGMKEDDYLDDLKIRYTRLFYEE